MKARIIARYRVGGGLADILALPGEAAVALSNHDRNVFVLQNGGMRAHPLARHATLARRASGISIIDRQFHQGALFPYGQGFGVIFADVVHLWDSPSAAPTTRELATPLALRDSAPISASIVPAEDEVVVLLDDDEYTGSGRFIARARLDGARAAWVDQPHDLAYDDFRGASTRPHPYPDANRLFPEITDLVALSSTTIRVHTVGQARSHARYGMDYSMIANVDEGWVSTPIAAIEQGYGTFSSDRQVLLLRHLHARSRLSFYSLDGVLQDTLVVSAKRVLGRVQDFFLLCDLCADHLWLGDGYGEVTGCVLTPG